MIRGDSSGVPLRKKLLTVLIIFLFITVISLTLTFIALGIQSSVRTYVAGEGMWSKAQRDATFFLELYGRTRNQEYFKKFEAALAIPLGYRSFRVEMDKPQYDPAVALAGLLAGNTHPDDTAGAIRLYRCCAQISYMQRAIDYWKQGDQHLLQLQSVALALQAEIGKAIPSAARIKELLDQVEAVNESVHPPEAAFTASLGEAARWVTDLLFLATASIIVVLVALGSYASWRILDSIRQSEERYRTLLNSASDALIAIDRDRGTVLAVNQRAEQITGRSAHELVGSRYADLLPGPQLGAAATPRQSTNFVPVSPQQISHRDGRKIPIEVNYSTTKWGSHPAHLAIIRDITERVHAERELRVTANALANMAEGVVITDAARRVVSVNHAYTQITGYDQAEVIGKVPRYPVARHNDLALFRSLWKTVRKTGHWQGEVWNQRKSGEIYPELLSVSAVRDEADRVTHYVGVFNDISAFKDYEQRLEHLAHHDALTQLPNRAAFEQQCAKALERSLRNRSQMALLFIDLDGFKAVNDTYGHAVGDQLLRTVGVRIRTCTRGDDVIARVGGDEFTVLLDNIAGPDGATLVARKLLDTLSENVQCGDHEVSVFASIGISFFPQDAGDVPTLLTYADRAMYEAKNRGRNNYQLFSPSMAGETSSRLTLATGLKQAIERGEFELHYQPCVTLPTRQIASVEALLRWHHPEQGLVSPATFIPLAEQVGLINAISEWVLATACEQGMAWFRGGAAPVPIAVNISARSFWDPAFPSKVAKILADTGWRPDWLCLEITESTIMNQDQPEKMLRELHAMGIRLAIDDFGVGYSSLSYLKQFPVQYLKIDRCFTSGIPYDASNLAIAKAIVALGKSLNLKVIAEGIETQEQYRVLREEGCDEGQGYLFSKPVTAGEMERLLRARLARTASAEESVVH